MNTSIPNWLACTQLVAFVVVYAVWILPETTALRNIALIIGAVASLYPIYLFRASILSKNSLPIWFMVSLFVWVIFHYFFIGENHAKQLEELNSIWKYAFILGIFGLGLGITLQQVNKPWINSIFFLGLSTPLIIFLIKIVWIYLASKYSFAVPEFIKIPISSSKFYIQKMDYIFFCIPAFIFALVNIYLFICNRGKINININIFSLLVAIFTIYLFREINTKNGMIYTFIFLIIFLLLVLKKSKNLLFSFIVILIVMPFYSNYYFKNPTLVNLVSDIKIASQTDRFQEWKNPNSDFSHIVNSNNKEISATTYFRIAWAVEGFKMIADNFMGYGLVEDSFRHLAASKWTDVKNNLNHTHSGWLDLVLGIGVPGAIFLLGSVVVIIFRFMQTVKTASHQNLFYFSVNILVAMLLMGITNEISSKSVTPFIVFWILLSFSLTYKVEGK